MDYSIQILKPEDSETIFVVVNSGATWVLVWSTSCLLTIWLSSLPGDMDISVFSKYVSEQKRVYPAVEGRITVRNSSSPAVHSLGLLLLLALYLPLSLALWSSAKPNELKPPPEYDRMPTLSYPDDRPVLFLKIKHTLNCLCIHFYWNMTQRSCGPHWIYHRYSANILYIELIHTQQSCICTRFTK